MEEQNTNMINDLENERMFNYNLNVNLDFINILTGNTDNYFSSLSQDKKYRFLYDQLTQRDINPYLTSACIDLALNIDKIIPQGNNFTEKEKRYYRNNFAYNLFKNVLNNLNTNKSTIIILLTRLINHKYPIAFKNFFGFSFNVRFNKLVDLALKHSSLDQETKKQIQDRIKNAKKNYIKRIFLENLEHAGESMINFINRPRQIQNTNL